MENDIFNLFLKTAKFYDLDCRDNLTADIPFYLDYAEETGREILELGCGTGRVAIPLAEAGFSVTGLDLSKCMLDIFKAKLDRLPEMVKSRIECIEGNMSNFSLNKKYDLIIAPFRAFQALTEEKDIISSLKCIHEHLNEDGRFIINVFRPYKQLDDSWCYPETVQWETTDQNTGIKITKKHWGSKINVEDQVIYPVFAYEISNGSGSFERIEEKLSLKYYYYQQLKDYLMSNGFDVREEYGWYDKSDIEDGRELIFVCKKGLKNTFSEQILADIIAQGLSGQDLLAKFDEMSNKIAPAIDKIVSEADSIASGEKSSATIDEIFGAEN